MTSYLVMVWFGFWCYSLLGRSYLTYKPNLSSIRREMTENLAFKGKLVWFGLDWFSLVWFGFLWSDSLDYVRRSTVQNLSAIGWEMNDILCSKFPLFPNFQNQLDCIQPSQNLGVEKLPSCLRPLIFLISFWIRMTLYNFMHFVGCLFSYS